MPKTHHINLGVIALFVCGLNHAARADDTTYDAPISETARERATEKIAADLLNMTPSREPDAAPVAPPVAPAALPVVKNVQAPIALKEEAAANAVPETSISEDIKNETAARAQTPALHPVVLKPPAAPAAAPAPMVTVASANTVTAVATPVAPTPPPGNDQEKVLNMFVGKPHVELGVDASVYKYREKVPGMDPFVNLSGYPGGIDAAVTENMVQNWYLRGEGRGVYGHVDYDSASGEKSHEPNYFGEIRGLLGKNFISYNDTFSFYSGAGYRYLYNDARGDTNSGVPGYRRISQYKYVPAGATVTHDMTDRFKLSGNIEYDFFTGGLQKSYLGDTGSAAGDIVNRQHHGKGIRGDTMLHDGDWSIGPWFNYWHIRESDFVPIPGVPGYGGDEPDNKTTEVGLKIVKQLW